MSRAILLTAPCLAVCVILAISRGADAPPDAVHAYRNARLLTAAGKPIDGGVLVVQKGKILSVGSGADVKVPAGAVEHDLAGKTVIPGLVDTHSHIGLWSRPAVQANSDGNEGSGAVQTGLRAVDAVNPDDPGIRMALAGGVTTANIMPGSGNVIGGQTVYVKLRGQTVEEMRIPGTIGGLKMANGENPKRFNFERRKSPPATRMKLAALQREQFVKAKDYQAQWVAHRKATAEKKDLTPPETDIAMEALIEVLDRKRTVHFHTHRSDDLVTALRLAEEFGFEIVLQHASEGYRIADELVRRKVPVSLTLLDSPGGKAEAAGVLEENAAILDKAGVKVAINTDDAITESRFFLRSGAIAVRGGMSEDAALRALTLHGAQMLHLDKRVGSLEAGKDADFVVLSGSPFSVYTQVLETYIEGVKVFDRSQHRDWTYQAGGFALADSEKLPRPAPVAAPAAVKAPAAPKDAPALDGNSERLAVAAGRIHTVGKGTITDGIILIENGKVMYVGARDELRLPANTPVLTAAVVTPGLIDAHTVVGLAGELNIPADQDQDELSDPNQADLRVIDGFNPNEPLLEFLRSQGVTVVHASPGRANVIAGQSGIFRTAVGTVERMTIRFPAALLVNLGETPKEAYKDKAPTTRMATANIVRAAFTQAQADLRKRSGDKTAPRNLKLEALGLALEKKVPVVFSAHRADDLMTALRLSKEFELRAMLNLATEGFRVADVIAESKTPVIVHPTMQRAGSSMETLNSHVGNAAILAEKKIPLAIGTGYESYVPKTRVVRHEAGMAMVHGLGQERALRAITLDAAKLLGIDDRYGSLEVGRAADLVLYDGDPFEHTTHVSATLIDGRVVYDRAEYLKVPYARRALPLTGGGIGCCLESWWR